MDVSEEITFEFFKHLEQKFVAGTGIIRKSVVAAQVPDLREAFSYKFVFMLHHINWILHGAETFGCELCVFILRYNKFLDEWEENLFFLQHVFRQFICDLFRKRANVV